MPIFSKFRFGKENIISGSDAAAIGVKLCKPKVLGIYPITPQTIICERLASMINNGEMNAEMVRTESEHSAISVVMGAQATGVRTFTATDSQGLALMHEVLHIISGLRLPVVMAVANRALSSPINIWCDLQDSMSQRDTGWIQLYTESCQEILDTIIQAYRISEHKHVMLPVMVCLDGFILSHLMEPVKVPTQKQVDEFLPRFNPVYRLDPKKPLTIGPVGSPDYFMEFKKQQDDAMKNCINVIKAVNKEFSQKFNRRYGDGLVEEYNLKTAKKAIVAIGSVCGTIKETIDSHDDVGLLRIRSFRPFPNMQILKALKNIKKVGIIDRAVSYGNNGQLFTEVKACLGSTKKINSFIIGLGGRDVKIKDVEFIIDKIGDGKNYWVNCNA